MDGALIKARALIEVRLRPEIADPQGQTVQRSLPELGWTNVSSVRIGKHVEVELEGPTKQDLERQVDEMCSKLLANPVLETYSFELVDA